MPHVVYLHSALVQDRIVPRDDASDGRCCATSASTS
jgi:Mn2+/Fe2+ NRAMP family transporter